MIVILDNDSGSAGANGIFQTLIGKSFPNITLTRDELRNQKWTWITKTYILSSLLLMVQKIVLWKISSTVQYCKHRLVVKYLTELMPNARIMNTAKNFCFRCCVKTA